MLTRLPSVTHTTDADNRTVVVTAKQTGTNYDVKVPASSSVLPPGWYYLFAMNGSTPSVAAIVRISSDTDGAARTPVSLVDTPLR